MVTVLPVTKSCFVLIAERSLMCQGLVCPCVCWQFYCVDILLMGHQYHQQLVCPVYDSTSCRRPSQAQGWNSYAWCVKGSNMLVLTPVMSIFCDLSLRTAPAVGKQHYEILLSLPGKVFNTLLYTKYSSLIFFRCSVIKQLQGKLGSYILRNKHFRWLQLYPKWLRLQEVLSEKSMAWRTTWSIFKSFCECVQVQFHSLCICISQVLYANT